MQHSPEIEQILGQAHKIAVQKNHDYVTVEHLTLALVKNTKFKRCIDSYGSSSDAIIHDLELFLNNQAMLVSNPPKKEPKKTNALERVFNRSLTQVMFSGRRSMETIDLWLAIMAETNSHASYFMLKHGLDKKEFTMHWQHSYDSKSKSALDVGHANDILEEH